MKDSEVHTARNGKQFLRATVLVAARRRREVREWVSVTAFGEDLAQAAECLTDGVTVTVSGWLTVSRWNSREGQPRSGLSMLADEMTVVHESDAQTSTTSVPMETVQPGDNP